MFTLSRKTINHMINRIKSHNLKNTATYQIYNVETSENNKEDNISTCKKAKLFSDHLNTGLIYDIVSTYFDVLIISKIPSLL